MNRPTTKEKNPPERPINQSASQTTNQPPDKNDHPTDQPTFTQQPASGWSWMTDAAPGLQHSSRRSKPGTSPSASERQVAEPSFLARRVLVKGLWDASGLSWVGLGRVRCKRVEREQRGRMARANGKQAERSKASQQSVFISRAISTGPALR